MWVKTDYGEVVEGTIYDAYFVAKDGRVFESVEVNVIE